MNSKKNVLLIGGGGTLGTYTAEELLRLGYCVDVICLEDKISSNDDLCFYKAEATDELLKALFDKKHYHGIINFIHYSDPDAYKPVHKLLSAHTDHLIFLSSYRVYADLEHPITENAPRLLDVSSDEDFLAREDYGLSKAKEEDFIRSESHTDNWTIVRPVISFSDKRLDIVMWNEHKVVDLTKEGKAMVLPAAAKDVIASLDWAGNSGKLIANLLFKEKALRETYTISTAQNLTWGEVADIYTELIGAKFEWIDTEKYIQYHDVMQWAPWGLIYDRLYNRDIDCSKVLKATGLNKEDFLSVKEGIKIELEKIAKGQNNG